MCDGSGLRLTFEGFDGHFDLNFEEEILTDKWTRGMVQRTNTTMVGENMIRVINTVEELGVEETKEMLYKQEGIEVCECYGCQKYFNFIIKIRSSVKNSEGEEAKKGEFYERV